MCCILVDKISIQNALAPKNNFCMQIRHNILTFIVKTAVAIDLTKVNKCKWQRELRQTMAFK